MHAEHFRSADLRTPYNSTTWRVPSVRMNAGPQHETMGRKGTFESPSDEENNIFTDFTASILGAMRHEIKKKKNTNYRMLSVAIVPAKDFTLAAQYSRTQTRD